MLKRAFQQAEHARECVETAITLVLINDVYVAHELWWNLAGGLKEPVLTLSLLPDNACEQADGRASLIQLRKWQLEQIAAIIKDVEQGLLFGRHHPAFQCAGKPRAAVAAGIERIHQPVA